MADAPRTPWLKLVWLLLPGVLCWVSWYFRPPSQGGPSIVQFAYFVQHVAVGIWSTASGIYAIWNCRDRFPVSTLVGLASLSHPAWALYELAKLSYAAHHPT